MAAKKPAKKRLKHPTPKVLKYDRLGSIESCLRRLDKDSENVYGSVSGLANQVGILQDILPAQERVCAKRAAETAVWIDNTAATKRELELESIRIRDLLSRTDTVVKSLERKLSELEGEHEDLSAEAYAFSTGVGCEVNRLDDLAKKVAELEKRFNYVAYPFVARPAYRTPNGKTIIPQPYIGDPPGGGGGTAGGYPTEPLTVWGD